MAIQRAAALRNELPRVIRPDLLLTEEGFIISELDSVPGGIGLTQWLNQTYAALGDAVIGGGSGMQDGFASIFGAAPKVHIVVSEEAASYRPEMVWLAARLGSGRFEVHGGEFDAPADGEAVYRFFELFDLPQVRGSSALIQKALEKRIRLTPPPRPIFEEKLLFALLWNRNLREFWRQELGEGFYLRLLKIVPRSWLLDPTPLPPHGAYPGLEITEWSQLQGLSQRDRALVLKISGFSPEAWGSRGVYLGSDLSAGEWGWRWIGPLRPGPDRRTCCSSTTNRDCWRPRPWTSIRERSRVSRSGPACARITSCLAMAIRPVRSSEGSWPRSIRPTKRSFTG